MGNDMSCQIKGIGKLNLLLKNTYILKLGKVSYVLELKRTLISLGKLDEDYDIRIHKCSIKLNLGQKEVIFSPKINGIYTLQAKPVVGYSSATVNSNSDKSLIWHKRLGHMSEKGTNYFE